MVLYPFANEEMRVGNQVPSETGRAGISTEDWGSLRLKNMILSGSGVRLSCTIFCHFLGAWPLLVIICVCDGETPRAETETVSQNLYEGLWVRKQHFHCQDLSSVPGWELRYHEPCGVAKKKTKNTSRKSLSFLQIYWAILILVTAESKLVWYCGLNCVTPKYMLKNIYICWSHNHWDIWL